MMLSELHVRDLALIEETWLEFGPGMTVLTGETGAGKTVLLSALKLLLGERADVSAVRAGAGEATVEGGFVTDESEMVVRRRVTDEGRSRCAINGEMATVGALAQRVGPLVDLHGQHEHQALLSSSTHVGYLDRWAGSERLNALDVYRSARAAWRAATGVLRDLELRVAEAVRDAEQLRFTVEEIERVAPQPGEDADLQARLPALVHSERLVESAGSAVALLRDEGGALDRIAQARAMLEKVAGIDPVLDEIAGRLLEAEALIDDASSSARSYRDDVEHDPAALEVLQARLNDLSGLVRRYGPTLDAVIATWDGARAALEAATSGDEALSTARDSAAAARVALETAADELARLRREAAPAFATALASTARDLAMEGARFEVSFSPLAFESWTDDGSERVEFLYATAPGQPARSLARIASGGEISRVMLALKGVLGSADCVGTLIFDEIDAGIGGATATAVGARLAELSMTHQVIVVTHLAQVAAFADAHFVVRKIVDTEGASTTVVPVEGEERVAELARMISSGDSSTALAHAAELLASARDASCTARLASGPVGGTSAHDRIAP